MEASNQKQPQEPEFDLDRLRDLAVAAGQCLADRVEKRAAGEPIGGPEPALTDFGMYCSPNIVLLALDRLRQAEVMLEIVKGGVSDLAVRKRIDVFFSGVLTQADLARAWPYYRARLQRMAQEATASDGVH